MERWRELHNFLACCLPEIFNSGRMKCEWPIAVVGTMRTDECGCVHLAQSIDRRWPLISSLIDLGVL